MSEMLSWTPLDAARWAAPFDLFTRNPFGMLDSIQRFFDGDNDTSSMRLEESVEGNTLVVRAELPGVDPDKDVEVTVADGVLTISARREEKTEDHSDGSHRSEFRYGSMLRRIGLPEGVTDADITASYKDGILEVRSPMPTAESVQEPAKVTITRS